MKIEKNGFGFGIQGVDAHTATPGFLGARKLSAVSDLGPEDLASIPEIGMVAASADVRSRSHGAGQHAAPHRRRRCPRCDKVAPPPTVDAHQDHQPCEERERPPMRCKRLRCSAASSTKPWERNSMRARNDALRQTFTGGRVVLSPGVLSLPPQTNEEVLERVRSFSAFDAENDPHHDFGRFDLAGVPYVFEVDCFARDIAASKDAIDTGKATRTLTIMRADEY
jgi:hypothetical protein